jgi:hypothetical protein
MSSETAEKHARAVNRYNDRISRGLKTALGNFSRVFMDFHQRELDAILMNEKKKLLHRVAADYHLNYSRIESRYLRGEMNEDSEDNSCSRDTIEEGKIAVSSKGKHECNVDVNPDDVVVNEYTHDGITYYYKDINDGEVFVEANDDIKIVGVYNRRKKMIMLEDGTKIQIIINSTNEPIGNIDPDAENVFIENTVAQKPNEKKERKTAGRKKKNVEPQSPESLKDIIQPVNEMITNETNEIHEPHDPIEPIDLIKEELEASSGPNVVNEEQKQAKSEGKKPRKKKVT